MWGMWKLLFLSVVINRRIAHSSQVSNLLPVLRTARVCSSRDDPAQTLPAYHLHFSQSPHITPTASTHYHSPTSSSPAPFTHHETIHHLMPLSALFRTPSLTLTFLHHSNNVPGPMAPPDHAENDPPAAPVRRHVLSRVTFGISLRGWGWLLVSLSCRCEIEEAPEDLSLWWSRMVRRVSVVEAPPKVSTISTAPW